MALAEKFEWEDAFAWADRRFEYDEDRWTAIGFVGARMYVVVFVDRADSRRIISLRKANDREVRKYAEA